LRALFGRSISIAFGIDSLCCMSFRQAIYFSGTFIVFKLRHLQCRHFFRIKRSIILSALWTREISVHCWVDFMRRLSSRDVRNYRIEFSRMYLLSVGLVFLDERCEQPVYFMFGGYVSVGCRSCFVHKLRRRFEFGVWIIGMRSRMHSRPIPRR
jgi:hypothetical protein